MALNDYKLTYTKDWKSAEDFPTYENREDQVRADMQQLFDEMRDAFNHFLDYLKASDVPFSATAAIAASTVQGAIETVQAQIEEIVVGVLPDDSVTTSKVEDLAITLPKLDVKGAENPNGTITPAALGAAAAAHTHDDRYYTETETDTKLAGKQDRTALLPNMTDEVADNDTLSFYDLSATAGKQLKVAALKELLKTYFDTIYGVLLETHAVRHAADGADPITVTTGSIADSAVTGGKIAAEAVSKGFSATISATWDFDGPPYTQEKTVSGIVAEDEDHPITWTINSGATTDQLTFVASEDKITVTTDAVFTGAISVTATQSNVPYNFTLAAADWTPTGKPMKQVISVPGLLATDSPIVDIVPSDTYSTAEAQLEDYGKIYRMVAGADTLTVYATEPTEVAIPIQIKAVRK